MINKNWRNPLKWWISKRFETINRILLGIELSHFHPRKEQQHNAYDLFRRLEWKRETMTNTLQRNIPKTRDSDDENTSAGFSSRQTFNFICQNFSNEIGADKFYVPRIHSNSLRCFRQIIRQGGVSIIRGKPFQTFLLLNIWIKASS